MDAIAGYTIGQIVENVLGLIAALSIFVEITPIKINPISSLLGWIGSNVNKDVLDKVNKINDRVASLETDNIVTARVRIIRFADEIRRGVNHSKESFDQTLIDIDKYERYCSKHPDFKNSIAVAATLLIKDTYSNSLKDNTFLK